MHMETRAGTGSLPPAHPPYREGGADADAGILAANLPWGLHRLALSTGTTHSAPHWPVGSWDPHLGLPACTAGVSSPRLPRSRLAHYTELFISVSPSNRTPDQGTQFATSSVTTTFSLETENRSRINSPMDSSSLQMNPVKRRQGRIKT